MAVFVEVPLWLPELTKITIEPRHEGLDGAVAGTTEPEACGLGYELDLARWRYQELGKLPVGTHHLEFIIRIDTATGEPPSDSRVLWTGTLTRNVEVVSKIDEVLTPISDAASTATVGSAVHLKLAHDPGGNGYRLGYYAGGFVAPQWAHIAFALQLDLCRDGAVQETRELMLWPRPSEVVHPVRFLPDWTYLEQSYERWYFTLSDRELAHWTVRVRGTSAHALMYWNADAYWNGEVVLPLDALPPP